MPNGISLSGFGNRFNCVTLIFFFMLFDSMKLSVNTFASSRLNRSKVITTLIVVDAWLVTIRGDLTPLTFQIVHSMPNLVHCLKFKICFHTVRHNKNL